MAIKTVLLSDNFTQFVNKSNELIEYVGDSSVLTTNSHIISEAIVELDSDLHGSGGGSSASLLNTDAKNIVAAINELDSDIGLRPHTNLSTTDKTLTGAINEISGELGTISAAAFNNGGPVDISNVATVSAAINTLDSAIGPFQSGLLASIVSRSNIVSVLNEFATEIASLDSGASLVGSVNDLTTTDKTSIVNAINELKSDQATIKGSYDLYVINSNTNAVANSSYVFNSSLTLTLPASPNVGDWIKVSDRSGTTTSIIGRNGNNIMGSATDLTLDVDNATLEIIYSDPSNGWVLQ